MVVLVVGKRRKSSAEPCDAPVDLAARIGMPAALKQPERAAPEPIRRVDASIEASRGRPLMIGANELPAPVPPAPAPEAVIETTVEAPVVEAPVVEAPAMEFAPLVATAREAPAPGEMDLVVTPLPTPDDWHHFELALRKVRGVGTIRTEYYRAGILKLRLGWAGPGRFAQALDGLPGYRVGVLGEDRTTLQIRVTRP